MDQFAFDVPVDLLVPTSIFLVIAAYKDTREFRIPNVLTGTMILFAFVYHLIFPASLGWFLGTCGLLVALFLLGILFFLGGLGAGDVKLFMGIGAWIGPQRLLLVYVVASLLVGCVSVGRIMSRRSNLETPEQKQGLWGRFFPRSEFESIEEVVKKSPQRVIPMGLLIAIAVLLLILWEMVRVQFLTVY